MPNDEGESSLQQLPARRDAVPRRGARVVRQRNEIKLRSGPFGAKLAANDLIQFPDWHELPDRQFSDRNHEPRLQDFELTIQPR